MFFRQNALLSSSLFKKYNKAWCWSPPYGRPACHQTFATQLKDVYAVLYQRDSSSSAAPRPLVSTSHEAKLLAWESLDTGQRKNKTLPHAEPVHHTPPTPLFWDPEQRAPVSLFHSHTSHFGSGAYRAPRGYRSLLFCARHGVIIRPRLLKGWNLSGPYIRLWVNLTRFIARVPENTGSSRMSFFKFVFSFTVGSWTCLHSLDTDVLWNVRTILFYFIFCNVWKKALMYWIDLNPIKIKTPTSVILGSLRYCYSLKKNI